MWSTGYEVRPSQMELVSEDFEEEGYREVFTREQG
jgi:hypothetical protein